MFNLLGEIHLFIKPIKLDDLANDLEKELSPVLIMIEIMDRNRVIYRNWVTSCLKFSKEIVPGEFYKNFIRTLIISYILQILPIEILRSK
jgi:hypothetical protein